MTWSRGAGLTILTFGAVALAVALGLLTGAIPTSGGGPDTTRNIGLIVGGVGLVSALFGAYALRQHGRAMRVLTGGLPGVAQVLRLKETGTEYSGVPQLELRLAVTTERHGTYQTTVKDLVPTLRLPQLTTGGVVPVRVDPEDKHRVLLDWDQRVDATVVPVQVQQQAAKPARPMLPPGAGGKAVVLGVTPALAYDGEGRPVFELTLHVELDGQAPVTVPARFGVPLDQVAGMVVGASLAVVVGPDGTVHPR